jgi:hypothetical protein
MNPEEHRKKHREYMRLYRQAHPQTYTTPEQKERKKADRRRSYWNNVEFERARQNLKYSALSPEGRYADRKKYYSWKRELIQSIKLASGCVDCGYKAHPEALHFDHLPQFEKKFGIGAKVHGKGKDELLAEINKCEVRCANCHAIKTAERRKPKYK